MKKIKISLSVLIFLFALQFTLPAYAQFKSSKSQKNAVSTQKMSKKKRERKAIHDYEVQNRVNNPTYNQTLKVQDKKTRKRMEKTKKKARRNALKKARRR